MQRRLFFGTSLLAAGLLAADTTHALNGTVTDGKGNPIANARVEVVDNGLMLTTDARGQFMHKLEAVDELHIYAPGYSHKVLHLHGEAADKLVIVLNRSVIEQVDVIGLPLHLSTMESAQPIAVVGGEELRNKQASTLGETLKNEVGVHSSYFGPVASSPIIRGLDGPRVLITQNGLDAGDASRVGPDHVVATEAATAQQIEILRGPATLFYGSGAIGGVVNIVDDRVPSDSAAKGAVVIGHNTVASENELSAAYTGGNQQFAVHLDGFWRDGDDYEIPGAARLESAAEHEEEGHEEHASGILPNSAAQGHGVNVGGSWLLTNGFVGLSYGRMDRFNGVPGHAEAELEVTPDEPHQEERVLSDLRQDRWQWISDLQLNGDLLSGINTRLGYTDYVHKEIHAEPTASPDDPVLEEDGTVFKNQTAQARIDLLHQELDGWRGALSVDAKHADFEALGAEAFTSPSTTTAFALALMEEKHQGALLWQLGARFETVEIKAEAVALEHHHDDPSADLDYVTFADTRFQPFSLSAGLVWDYATSYKVSAAIAHSQRAPTASELFALGPHLGTGAYEIGALFEVHQAGEDIHLDYVGQAQKETANNLDLSLRKHEGQVGFVLTAFYNQVDDFYYQRYTGLTTADIFAAENGEDIVDGHDHASALPVYIFEQADASFYGIEAELGWQITDSVQWTGWGDSVHGELDDGAYIPRLSPKRLGSHLQFEHNAWLASLEVTRYFRQDHVAVNETATDGYTLLDAQLAHEFDLNLGTLTLFVKAHNLTNQEARVHTSFLKDQAPLPARGFSVGLRGRL